MDNEAWNDVKEQAKIAGVDPNDPAFLKYAQQAPWDIEFYDQVSWAIANARDEIEARNRPKEPRGVTIGDAVREALEANKIR